MTRRLERTGTILRAIVHEVKVEQITFMAGSIAYNAFVSLLPLLFLLLAVVSAVGGGQLESNMISLTQSVVTPGAGEVLVTELRSASAGASVLGLVVLAWGMLRIFRSLDTAFSDIYETEAENTFTNQLIDGIVVFGSMAAVVVAVLALESVVPVSAASGPFWFVQRFFLICGVALALTPMYYLFPDETDMDLIEIVPGVFFTASALIIFQSVFSLYIEYSSQTAESGILASVLLFLTWLYFSGLVILLGAAINAVLSNRSEDVNIEPVVGGVPKAETEGFEGDVKVPDETLQRVNHSLSKADEFEVSFEGDEQTVTLPAPDIVTVDADTSPLPGLNDTATLELQWAQDKGLQTEE